MRRLGFCFAICCALLGSLSGCGGDDDDDAVGLLSGEPGAPASPALPVLAFTSTDNFSDDHPDLPGLWLSTDTLHLVLAEGATIDRFNAALRPHGGSLVGGRPGHDGLPGVAQIRFGIDSHAALEPIRAELAAHPAFAIVVQDVLLTPLALPRPNPPVATWSWELAAAGGNWGHELSRVPQLWNLNPAMDKLDRSTTVAVTDLGFDLDHPDLSYVDHLEDVGFSPGSAALNALHGTHVAGILAADYDNQIGVDGVHPRATLVLHTATGLLGFAEIADEHPEARVLNVSLGSGLVEYGLDPDNPLVAGFAAAVGGVVAATIALIGEESLPTLVVAAGNDSGEMGPFVSAKLGSPFAWAAAEAGAGNIVVVENVRQCDAASCPFDSERQASSNVDGLVSAPGTSIVSLAPGGAYGVLTGTSMAAPLVSGLVSYLYAIEPSLTHTQVKDLLLVNAVDALGAAPRVDAWATALDIDRVLGGDAVLRLVLDIDDGTADGNTRVDPLTGAVVDDGDADGDGGPGDGQIDMADFRRWRDAVLQVEGIELDGGADHPRRDLNGDRLIDPPVEENRYPRADFNGSGRVSRDGADAAPVSGYALAQGAVELTDLEVLQLLFDDPHHAAAELPGLVDSGDLYVAPLGCLAHAEVDIVETVVRDDAGVEVASHVHEADSAARVYTLPAGQYTVELRALGADGEPRFTDEAEFTPTPGSDDAWDSDACADFALELTFPGEVTAGGAAPLLVRATFPGDDPQPLEDVAISVEVSDGEGAPAEGLTDAEGYFDTTVEIGADAEQITVFVTAVSPSGATVVELASADVVPPAMITPTSRIAQAAAQVLANQNAPDDDRDDAPEDEFGPVNLAAAAEADDEDGELSGSGSAGAHLNATTQVEAGALIGGSGSMDCQSTALQTNRSRTSASGGATLVLGFEVGGDAVDLSVDVSFMGADAGGGSLSVSGGDGFSERVAYGAMADGGGVSPPTQVWSLAPGRYQLRVAVSCSVLAVAGNDDTVEASASAAAEFAFVLGGP